MKRRNALLAAALLVSTVASAQTLPLAAREKIVKATVMLLPTTKDGKLAGTLGSGSIISPAGYILTNYHVIGDIENREISPWIQVRTIRFIDQEPVPTYWGEVVAADPNLDLAIVKITEDKDQKAVSNLNLPYVQLGDSNALMLGDPIYVFGFQGTGGMTLSYSQGTVGGFTGDDLQSSGKQWVKHDAQTGPGNSGGGIFDASGDLIGIHSAGVSGDHNSRTSYMRPLAVAWGLITPNVPKFAVRPNTSTVATKPSGTTESKPASQSTSGSGSNLGQVTSWPPKIAVGQSWGIALNSKDLQEVWQIDLKSLTSKGNPRGPAGNGKTQSDGYLYYSKDDDAVWFDLAMKSPTFVSCMFARSGLKEGALTGKMYFFENDQDKGSEIGTCAALPITAGAISGSAGTGSSSPASGSKLSWPLRPQPGQRWTFQIPTFGEIKLTLSGTDELGAVGKATFKDGTEIDAFYYYSEKDQTTWLDIEDGNSLLYCSFDAKGIGGTGVSGIGYYRKDKKSDKDADKLGTCTGKLS